jgi:hypothetical protein
MLAFPANSVNGKCVLVCTIEEKLWNNLALSAASKEGTYVRQYSNLLILIGLKKAANVA